MEKKEACELEYALLEKGSEHHDYIADLLKRKLPPGIYLYTIYNTGVGHGEVYRVEGGYYARITKGCCSGPLRIMERRA